MAYTPAQYALLVSENEFIIDDDRNSDAWDEFVAFITDKDDDGHTSLDTVLQLVRSDSGDLSRKIVVSLVCAAFIHGYNVGEAVGAS